MTILAAAMQGVVKLPQRPRCWKSGSSHLFRMFSH